MATPASFTNAVAAGNLTLVRVTLKNSLLTDPTFRQFAELQKEAENMPGLYEKFNGEPLPRDKSLWTEEYLAKQAAELIANFCRERIQYVKEIVSHLSPPEQTGGKSFKEKPHSNSGYDYFREKEKDSRNNDVIRNHRNAAQLCMGGGFGAIAGCAIAAAAETSIFGGIVAGALLGAVVGGIVGGKRRQ